MIDGLSHSRGTVWVIHDGRLARRTLTFGQRTLDGRHEAIGLAPGETIVVERNARLIEGRTATARAAP
jgi:hypothetical protein